MKVGMFIGKVKKFGIGWCIPHRMAADNADGVPPPELNRVKIVTIQVGSKECYLLSIKVIQIVSRYTLTTCPLLHGNKKKETDTGLVDSFSTVDSCTQRQDYSNSHLFLEMVICVTNSDRLTTSRHENKTLPVPLLISTVFLKYPLELKKNSVRTEKKNSVIN